jgi:hypothetical protein
MDGYYIYLVSSLPMLQFGMKPPFSFERLLRLCDGLISDENIDILRSVSAIEEYAAATSPPTLPPKADQPLAESKWRDFDISLRNELVKIRAARRRIDPNKYLRGGGYPDPSVAHIALHAHRTLSIIEGEEILDRERWRFLDELSVGHYFDIDALIIYAIKLLILERWERINTADGSHMVETTVAVEPKV